MKVKDNKDFFKKADILLHWRENRTVVKGIIREHQIKKNAFDLIYDKKYIFLFEDPINQHDIIKEIIRQSVGNRNPLFSE